MSLINRRALLPAATLLIAVAGAQTCFYPNGKTTSTDIPCDPSAPASSCCGSDSFCLVGGLCYGGGIVTRGTCTDKSWNSAACATHCTDEDTSSEIAITPCTSGGSSNTFVCGVNTTDCQSDSNTFTLSSDTSLVLRPAQIAALVGSSLQTSTATGAQVTVTSIPEGYYTGGAMAGLAIGIALPLLIALGIMYILLRKERKKFGHGKPKLMYKLPDDIQDEDFTPTRPPPVSVPAMPTFESNRSSHVSAVTSMATSRRGSLRTIHTTSSRPVLSRDFPPNQSQTFLERYETMKRAAQVQSMEVSVTGSPQELDSTPTRTPTKESPRYELSDTRMST